MIQIIKTLQPPAILLGKGKAKCVAMKRLYTRFPSDYLAGSRKFSFDPQVYGHSTVKDALIKAQDGKCCFCESQILHISYGDVEHFRPKAGYCQKASDPIQKPGYYWLAYDWDNLLLCCQLCNQRHKMYQITQIAPDHPGDRRWQELSSKAQATLKNAVKDSAQYAGMARSAVANNFQL